MFVVRRTVPSSKENIAVVKRSKRERKQILSGHKCEKLQSEPELSCDFFARHGLLFIYQREIDERNIGVDLRIQLFSIDFGFQNPQIFELGIKPSQILRLYN